MIKVILIDTKEKSRLCYLTKKGKEEFHDLRLFETEMPIILDSINIHAYIVDTNTKIEKYNYVEYKNNVYFVEQDETNMKFRPDYKGNPKIFLTEFNGWVNTELCNKVIATSNPELSTIPKLSEESLQLISEYNGNLSEFDINISQHINWETHNGYDIPNTYDIATIILN